MFIFVGPCHLSSTKQCSGDLMFPCEQLVFSVIKVINNPKFVLLRNLYCRYVHLNFFSKTSQCPLKTNGTQKTLNLLYRAAVISQSRCVHLVKLAEVWRKSQQLTFRKSSGSHSTACKVGKKNKKKTLTYRSSAPGWTQLQVRSADSTLRWEKYNKKMFLHESFTSFLATDIIECGSHIGSSKYDLFQVERTSESGFQHCSDFFFFFLNESVHSLCLERWLRFTHLRWSCIVHTTFLGLCSGAALQHSPWVDGERKTTHVSKIQVTSVHPVTEWSSLLWCKHLI